MTRLNEDIYSKRINFIVKIRSLIFAIRPCRSYKGERRKRDIKHYYYHFSMLQAKYTKKGKKNQRKSDKKRKEFIKC